MVQRQRKNFFPTFFLNVFFWITFIGQIIFIEPDLIKNILIPNFYLPFFLNLFLALFLTLAIIFTNSRRGLLGALGVVIFLILRLLGLGNILNAILIAGILIACEYYFTKSH